MKHFAAILIFVFVSSLVGCAAEECEQAEDFGFSCSVQSSPVATPAPVPVKEKLEKVCNYEVGDFCLSYDWVVRY